MQMTVETGIPAYPLSGERGEEYQSSPLAAWIGGGGSNSRSWAEGIDLATSAPKSRLGAASGLAWAAFLGLIFVGLFSGTGRFLAGIRSSSSSKSKRHKMD